MNGDQIVGLMLVCLALPLLVLGLVNLGIMFLGIFVVGMGVYMVLIKEDGNKKTKDPEPSQKENKEI